jgi:hypothetical protein
MLSAMRREFGIDPDWILHGPGEIPRRHASELDWERLQRLQEEIRHYAYQIGLEPSGPQLLDLARAVFDEAPEVEEAALGRMKRTLKALAKGKV